MLRTLKGPKTTDAFTGVLTFPEGGLGGTTKEESLANIAGIPASEINQPNGPILLGDNGLPAELISDLYKAQISVDGPTSVAPGAKAEWYLTAYDSFTNYTIEGVLGTATIERNIVTFTAGNVAGDGGFVINGVRIHIAVTGSFISIPTILSPSENSETGYDVTVSTSSFVANSGTDTHASTDWEAATDPEFYNIVSSSYANTTDKLSHVFSGLDNSQSYYVRARHNGAAFGASNWSATRHFKTSQEVALAPVVIAPVSGTVDLEPMVTFTLAPFANVIEDIQIPKKDSDGTIVAYVGEQRITSHVSTEWQLATNAAFTLGLREVTTEADVFSLTMTSLLENQSYYLRARFTTSCYTPTEITSGGTRAEASNAVTAWSQLAVYHTNASFAPSMPYIVTPEGSVVNAPSKMVVQASTFVSPSGEMHASTDWELSTSPEFLSFVVKKEADTENKVTLPLFDLTPSTTYYLRARYRDSSGSIGPWSPVRTFQTAYSFLPLITTVFATVAGTKYNFKGSNYVSPTETPQLAFDVEVRYGDAFETSVVDDVVSLNGLAVLQPDGKNNYRYTDTTGHIGDNNYWARIRYVDEDGWTGPWSAPMKFKTKAVV